MRAGDPRVVTAKRLHKDRSLSIDQICGMLGISRPTFYRYLSLLDVLLIACLASYLLPSRGETVRQIVREIRPDISASAIANDRLDA